MDIKDYLLIGLAGVIIWLYIVNLNQQKEVMSLRINTAYYEDQNEKLDLKRDSILQKLKHYTMVIDSLKIRLNQIPTDEQVIIQNPIKRVSINDDWTNVIRPIDDAINPDQE